MVETKTQTSYKSGRDGYFPALTGLRAIAAYMVFVHHFSGIIPDYLGRTVQAMGRELHIGVTIFFVLSGFLIYHRYGQIERLSVNWFKAYYRNRFARIYPMYFLLLLLTYTFTHFPGPKETFLNFSLFKGFWDKYKFSGIAPAWSLTVEECFYLSAPFIFLFIGKFSHKKGFFWLPLLLILGAGLLVAYVNFPFNVFYGDYNFVYTYTFFGRAVAFFVGMYLAKLVRQGDFWLSSFVKKLPLTYLSSGAIGLIVYLTSLLASPEYEYGVLHPVGRITDDFGLPICVAGLLYGLITEQTLLRKLLASRLLVLLGASSYTFYLIHVGVIHLFIYEHVSTDHLVRFIALNLCAVILFKLVEEPLNRLIRGRKPKWVEQTTPEAWPLTPELKK